MNLTWANERRRLRELVAWEHNPRQIGKAQASRLADSLEQFGQIHAIAIGPDGEIYDGHQRTNVWAAVDKFGPDYEVDVRVASRPLTEAERRKLVTYLHSGTTGDWDWDALSGWDVGELVTWGFDAEQVAAWDNDAANLRTMIEAETEEPPADPGAQVDRAEELREKWGVELGQLWRLGEHRLICGDCTDPDVVARVLQGETPMLMVTDPPYGVEYDPMWRQEALGAADRRTGKVANDDRSDWSEAWALFPGVVLYCWSGMLTAKQALDSIVAAGFITRAEIVWAKDRAPFGRGHYVPNHESCWYAVRDGAAASWVGNGIQTTVWSISIDETVDGGHGTQKPLECMERPIRNHEGDVYEPFCGSGTTIIAAERQGRRCFAVEIEPKYVAVTIERWVDMTGKTPELVG